MDWTKFGAGISRWTLDADPGYMAEKWGMGSYTAYWGNTRICGYGTLAEAQAAAEAHYGSAEARIERATALIDRYAAGLHPDAGTAHQARWVLSRVLGELTGGQRGRSDEEG